MPHPCKLVQGEYDEDNLPEDRVERKKAKKDKADKGAKKGASARTAKCAHAPSCAAWRRFGLVFYLGRWRMKVGMF